MLTTTVLAYRVRSGMTVKTGVVPQTRVVARTRDNHMGTVTLEYTDGSATAHLSMAPLPVLYAEGEPVPGLAPVGAAVWGE